jgi:acyl dehydratase
MRYFEDFTPEQVIELGRHTITKDEIITFAKQFDPQVFHLDEIAAKDTIFGGLIASGWHTGSLMMRMLYEGVVQHVVSLGSPGVDELRWMKPVRPGDTLSGRLTVTECVPSRSKPDRGIVKSTMEMRNQYGEVVVSAKGLSLFGRRPSGTTSDAGR